MYQPNYDRLFDRIANKLKWGSIHETTLALGSLFINLFERRLNACFQKCYKWTEILEGEELGIFFGKILNGAPIVKTLTSE